MTRIVAGLARGRQLTVPAGASTRPTADRAREGLFSTLDSLRGGPGGGVVGARVLDLYAGTGALGLEALSRGASSVLLVDDDPRALRALRENVRRLALPGAAVRAMPVERLAADPPPGGPFDVLFADPPYRLRPDALAGVLAGLLAGGWLVDRALLVVERPSRDPAWQWPAGVRAERARRYGEATLWYGFAIMDGTA